VQLVFSNLRVLSPTNKEVFMTGDNIPLVAEVTATEEPVSQVEFFYNGISIGATGSPYSVVWGNPGKG